VKGNVVSIRTARQPDASSSGGQRIGTAGTEALYLEMPIRVLGHRAAAGPGGEMAKGEPFQEDTTTMLLFARGAVIRLGEPAARGQEVLLVNKRTNKYVHSRIKNRRTSPDEKSYVEIEFTHMAPDFWGISFPKEPIQSAGAGSAPEPPAWPAADSRTESRGEPAVKAMAAAVGAAHAATPVLPAEREVNVEFRPSMPTTLADWDESAARIVSPQLPAEMAQGQSMLDRVQTAPKVVQFVNLESLIIPEPRSRRVRLAVMAAAALCAMIVGYRFFSPTGTEAPAVTQDFASITGEFSRVENAGAASTALAGRETKPFDNGSDVSAEPASPSASPASKDGSTVTAAVPEITPVESPKRLMVLVSKMNLPVQSVTLGHQDAPEIPTAAGGAPAATAPELSAKGPEGAGGLLAPSNLAPPPPPEPTAAPEGAAKPGDALVPARLITSVQPAYPLLAKQTHIEGNVVIEAQVDAAGNVTGAKVVSGPQALRQAAVNAVVRWKFEPARLRDWPTASTTVVTLRFVLR
jgi:protein TonB